VVARPTAVPFNNILSLAPSLSFCHDYFIAVASFLDRQGIKRNSLEEKNNKKRLKRLSISVLM
jgi:hypothetical protein